MTAPGLITRPADINLSTWKTVSSVSQFPPAVDGVITLADNTAYIITGTVDLGGHRLVGGQNSTLFGMSPEQAILKSTGFDDANGAFITSQYSIPILQVGLSDFGAQQVLDIDGDGNDAALDWYGVNFRNCSNVGTIANVNNFISNTTGFLDSGGLTFDGSIGTISFADTLFETASGTTMITLPSTLTVTRRFRVIYSSFVVLSGETALDTSGTPTVPDEGFILSVVNFSGGGTYLSGFDSASNKSRFEGCRGIQNTASVGHMYFTDNATTTTVTDADTYYKIAGTTTVGNLAEKFTHTTGRLTYTGALSGFFKATASINVQTSTNTDFSFRLGKNGTTSASGEVTVRQQSNTSFSAAVCQDIFEMQDGDYIEPFIAASAGSKTPLVADLNLIITRLTD